MCPKNDIKTNEKSITKIIAKGKTFNEYLFIVSVLDLALNQNDLLIEGQHTKKAIDLSDVSTNKLLKINSVQYS